MTDTSSEFGPGRDRAASHPHVLEVLPQNLDESDGTYTFVPRDATDDERVTQWITADSDAVLDLAEWR